MNTISPAPLKKGDTIGVMSTSCWLEEEDLTKAKEFIEGQGYKVFIHPQATARLHQSAGSAGEKAKAVNELFANPDIRAIMGSRGGNRASTMLDKIDFDLIKNNPKIMIGYSDLTFLINAVYKQCNTVTFHGPLFRELPTHPQYDQMMGVLSGETDSLDLSHCRTLRSGEAEGTLLGGNLSVIQALVGTPYMPDMRGAILILEDIGDHLSRYDRMLCHFKNAGILAQLSGLIVGSFTDTKESEGRPFGFTLEDVILEHTQDYDYPILTDAPFGHGDELHTLPIGVKATLKNGTLSFKAFA